MEESHGIHNLLAATEVLRTSIQKSRELAIAVDETGSRLRKKSHNLAHLQAAAKDMAHKCAAYKIGGHISRAIGPATTVLKVLSLVDELHDSLRADYPRAAGLSTYLANIKRLQEALKLLTDNCGLVMTWLEDAVRLLKSNEFDGADDQYLHQLSRVVEILVELRGRGELFHRNGGALFDAFGKVESEYRNLLAGISFVPFSGEDPSLPVVLSPPVVRELREIVEGMVANSRLDKCASIFVQVRIANAQATLDNTDYMEIIRSSEIDDLEGEDYVNWWVDNMEFSVRHLLRKEHGLCREVFARVGSSVDALWMSCFSRIAIACGFINILEFGGRICGCRKEAVKLLRLLKIFSTLDSLRLEFNELFDGKFCAKIQNQTRDLVRKVVYGACEIFWQLSTQVEMQRASEPPPDGSIPRLISFVAEYCNRLLADENRSILIRVLEIYRAWNRVKFDEEEGLLSNEIHNIMRALEVNLATWAQRYKNDSSLSHFFMMNNYWYLLNNIRGTKLGDLMGDSWLSKYEESVEYYEASYMRESWGNILSLLREEGLILFPGGRAVDRNLVDKRVRLFCEAFDDLYRKQSKWMCDKALRWKVCQMIVKAVVTPYETYLHRFMAGLEMDDRGRNVKYTPEKLEKLIGALFQPQIGKYGGSKCTDLIGVAMNHSFPSTPAAA